MHRIVEFGQRIGREFHPDKVVLFGSYASGQAAEDSDVDMLAIMPFEGKGFYQSLEILNRLDPAFAVDMLACQPGDAARRYTEGDPLIRTALDHGKVLYERND
jgi:predicted nucleotidyltransferase